MRQRDPRRLFARSREARARVSVVRHPETDSEADGSVTSRNIADVAIPDEEIERIWNPEYLERLARTYWRFLTRVSLGLIRIAYSEDSREVVLVRKPFVLLRFRAPEYETSSEGGKVTWRIDKGLLVAPRGRGKGFLRISVDRPEDPDPDDGVVCVRVVSEVANFYPMLAGWGWWARIGAVLYRSTQYAIHNLVTNAFFRSLAKLDLAPSVVGKFRQDGGDPGQIDPPPRETELTQQTPAP